MSFRDSTVIIIENGRTKIRAGLGLHDLLKTPAVVRSHRNMRPITYEYTQEFPARVGLRKGASGEHLNQSQLPIAPSENHRREKASLSRPFAFPQHHEPNASVNDYLVGEALDEALAEHQEITISWPFAGGDVYDWTQAEAIWHAVSLPLPCHFLTSPPKEIYPLH